VRVGPAGPERYYGTVDATPLWISLLHDAWRWGLADADVAELLPNLEAALGWLREATGDGFVRYVDNAGVLSNQGWKDSFDSIQFSDGRLAEPPIALCEVQAYAFAAAMDGRRAAGRVRPPRRGRLAALGGRPAGPVPLGLLGRGPARALSRDRAGRRRPAGSTRSPPTSATCSAPGSWTRPRPPR
jgi:hypothetical protein